MIFQTLHNDCWSVQRQKIVLKNLKLMFKNHVFREQPIFALRRAYTYTLSNAFLEPLEQKWEQKTTKNHIAVTKVLRA